MSKLKCLPLITAVALAIITQALLSQAPLYAGVYKWTDDNGQVHYGSRPGNTDAEKLTIRTNETTKPRAIKTAEEETTEESAQNGAEDGSQASEEIQPEIFVEEKIPAKEKRQLCNQAKNDIASINSRGRMREINAKGEYIYLTEQQKQQRLSAAKKRKKKYCR